MTIDEATNFEVKRKADRYFEPKRNVWTEHRNRAVSVPSAQANRAPVVQVLQRRNVVKFAEAAQSFAPVPGWQAQSHESQVVTTRDIEGMLETLLDKSQHMKKIRLENQELKAAVEAANNQVGQLRVQVASINTNQGDIMAKLNAMAVEQTANEARLREERREEQREVTMALMDAMRSIIREGANAAPTDQYQPTSMHE